MNNILNNILNSISNEVASRAMNNNMNKVANKTENNAASKVASKAASKRIISAFLAIIIFASLIPSNVFAALTAAPTTSVVVVDGVGIYFDAYNINDNNYFKLRDLAYVLDGTPKQFDVTWDGARDAISLTSGASYTYVGGELTGKGFGEKTPVSTSSKIYLNDRLVSFTAYYIEGNNYFKLRDVGEAFDFGVTWDGSMNQISIDTSARYLEDTTAAPANGVPDESGTELDDSEALTSSEGVDTTSTTAEASAKTPGKIALDESKVLTSLDVAQVYGLSQAEMNLYNQLYVAIMNFEMAIDVDVKIETDEEKDVIIKLSELIYLTLPDYYMFTAKVGASKSTNGGYFVFPVYSVNGKELRARFQDGKLVYPPDEDISEAKTLIASRKSAVLNALNDLPINDGMTQFELEVAVHDWLCANIEYNKNPEEEPERKTIYNAITRGQADCVGFARSFKYVLGLLDIESAIVTGLNNGANHAWNVVKLDGHWYNVDASSNSLNRKILGVSSYHWYFNRTDEFFNKALDKMDVRSNPQVACTSVDYDFYRKTGARIASDADLTGIPPLLMKARADGAQMIELEYDPAYGEPEEIAKKLKTIYADECKDVEFLFNNILIYGVFG